MRKYRIDDPTLNERYGYHSADDESLKTIAEEIRLLRAMIEDRLAQATNSVAERQAAFSIVTPWLAKVAQLVETLSKLEKQSSALVGKAALQKLGGEIVKILIDELNDIPGRDTVIDTIAGRIADAIAEAKNDENS